MMPDEKDTIRLIAEMLAWLQVPGSMGVFGAAAKPWTDLRDQIGVRGWHTADEAETALRAVLSEVSDA